MLRMIREPRGALALALVAALAACDGQNQFSTPIAPTEGGQGGAGDTRAPDVEIVQPQGANAAAPVGDTIRVVVNIDDNQQLDSARFEGIALRGDPELGTDSVVERFASKLVVFDTGVRDTLGLMRDLIATEDTLRETVLIVVNAYDVAGNLGTDTTTLQLGGPDVVLRNVEDGQTIQAGLGLSIGVTARDPEGVDSVRVTLSGAYEASVSRVFSGDTTVAVFDTVVAIPADVRGDVTIDATAYNALEVPGQAAPVTLTVVAAAPGDTARPLVRVRVSALERLELADSLVVTVSGRDDNQGSGIVTAGYTVRAVSPRRGVVEVRSDSRDLGTPLTGNVSERFSLASFNVDSLSLPDSLVFEVTGFLVDAEGNCGAAVQGDTLQSLPCTAAPGGGFFAGNASGLRVPRAVVAGRTVDLPTGGQIMDAVIDTTRRNLYLSNIDRDRIEVFRLQDEAFLPAIAVGSEPWGLSLDREGDSLLVANSGGTNISFVDLGPAFGTGPFVEDDSLRFITPDVVLFDVERAEDELGFIRYVARVIPDAEPPGFSDRPQFMAVDSTGRILYSTKVTELGDFGTIRKAFVPDPAGLPEVKLFFEHAALLNAPDFIAIGNVDDVSSVLTNDDDELLIQDHVPGFPFDTIFGGPAAPATAAAEVASLGSDVVIGTGRWNVPGIGFSDTTYVTASGDGGWVVFGEGSVEPVGRIIMYEASADRISDVIEVTDLMTNASETVRGIGLNYDGTLGVARGNQAYFFTTDLRLQGVADLPAGGAGAVLHPLHADAKSFANFSGAHYPNTHMAFVGTGERTIDIINTFHFLRTGRVFIRDIVAGPLRAVLPFPEDNEDFQCVQVPVEDQAGDIIGMAVQIYENDNFETPYPPDGPTEDRCVVAKLFGVTDTGGVVVVDVRKADVLRNHPNRAP